MLEILGQAALRTLALAAIVQSGLWLLRIRRPQLRLIAWTVVLAASLAMPALQWANPLRLSVLPDLPGTTLIDAAGAWRQEPGPETSTPTASATTSGPAEATPWLELLYLLVAGILLLRLTVGVALSLKLLVKATPVHVDWAADTRIRVSRDIVAPVTVAHVILLPSNMTGWSTSTREAVLAHERAHIARWDFAMLLASQLNQAVFWFNPLSWWLHRRLAALAELTSDDQAMEVTRDRPGYAAVLLEMGPPLRPPLARPGHGTARDLEIPHRTHPLGSAEHAPREPDPTSDPRSRCRQSFDRHREFAVQLRSTARTGSVKRAEPAKVGGPQPVAPNAARPGLPRIGTVEVLSDRSRVRAAIAASRGGREGKPPAHPRNAPATTHQTARTTPAPPPARIMVQRVRTTRDQAAASIPPKAVPVVFGGSAPRSNDGPATTNSPSSAAGAPAPALQTGQPPTSEPPSLKRTDEPSCTGVYLPRPGTTRPDGPLNFLQAKYFQTADGTPWLKLFLGQQTRAKLTGFEVDRTSIHTTVLTTLPRSMNHVTGTTHGTYGAIDFECAGSKAQL